MADKNKTHTYTKDYVPYPVTPNQEYIPQRLRAMMQKHKVLLGGRTSVTLVGIPAGTDLFTMTPVISYIEGEDGLPNLRSIVEILYRATAGIN